MGSLLTFFLSLLTTTSPLTVESSSKSFLAPSEIAQSSDASKKPFDFKRSLGGGGEGAPTMKQNTGKVRSEESYAGGRLGHSEGTRVPEATQSYSQPLSAAFRMPTPVSRYTDQNQQETSHASSPRNTSSAPSSYETGSSLSPEVAPTSSSGGGSSGGTDYSASTSGSGSSLQAESEMTAPLTAEQMAEIKRLKENERDPEEITVTPEQIAKFEKMKEELLRLERAKQEALKEKSRNSKEITLTDEQIAELEKMKEELQRSEQKKQESSIPVVTPSQTEGTPSVLPSQITVVPDVTPSQVTVVSGFAPSQVDAPPPPPEFDAPPPPPPPFGDAPPPPPPPSDGVSIEEAARLLGINPTALGTITDKEIKAVTTQIIKSLNLGFGAPRKPYNEAQKALLAHLEKQKEQSAPPKKGEETDQRANLFADLRNGFKLRSKAESEDLLKKQSMLKENEAVQEKQPESHLKGPTLEDQIGPKEKMISEVEGEINSQETKLSSLKENKIKLEQESATPNLPKIKREQLEKELASLSEEIKKTNAEKAKLNLKLGQNKDQLRGIHLAIKRKAAAVELAKKKKEKKEQEEREALEQNKSGSGSIVGVQISSSKKEDIAQESDLGKAEPILRLLSEKSKISLLKDERLVKKLASLTEENVKKLSEDLEKVEVAIYRLQSIRGSEIIRSTVIDEGEKASVLGTKNDLKKSISAPQKEESSQTETNVSKTPFFIAKKNVGDILKKKRKPPTRKHYVGSPKSEKTDLDDKN